MAGKVKRHLQQRNFQTLNWIVEATLRNVRQTSRDLFFVLPIKYYKIKQSLFLFAP